MRAVLLVCVVLLLGVGLNSAAAQEDGLPVVEDVIYMREIIDFLQFSMAVLAPDGSALAYPTQGALCLYWIDTAETTCTEFSDFRSRVTGLVWSRDSAYLAFTEDLFIRLHESDVWVMDVAAGTISNLTDDGVVDDFFSLEDPVPLDTMPFWGPDGTLYFLRAVSDAELSEDDATLMRVDPAGGEAEEVMPLTGVPLFSVFELSAGRALEVRRYCHRMAACWR